MTSRDEGLQAAEKSRVQVRVKNLSMTFHRSRRESVPVLKGLNLEIEDGELLVLLGPSGCGKTTLLRCLVGLERPTHGEVWLGEQSVVDTQKGIFVPPNRRDVGMVFQNYALWPHMSVRKNVEYPLRARSQKDALLAGRVDEVLRIVQSDHLAERYPPELSGGQQQRVALARALAPRPRLLLLDEPLSNLDALLRIELRAQLRHLHRELQFTGVYVTHDQEEALSLATRVAVMREGGFEQIGTPTEIHTRPATENVAEFLGVRNRFPVKGDKGRVWVGQRQLSLVHKGISENGSYSVRVRPEKLSLRSSAKAHPGKSNCARLKDATVLERLPAGEFTDYMLELDDLTLFARLPDELATHCVGDRVDIGFSAEAALIYDRQGKLLPA